MDGYDKKKYVAKVVFTYILGYQVDVGHMEAINLISSPKYSEKQIVSSKFMRVGVPSPLTLFYFCCPGLPRNHTAHA